MLLKAETRRIYSSLCDDKTAIATATGVAVNPLPPFCIQICDASRGSLLTSRDRNQKYVGEVGALGENLVQATDHKTRKAH